MNERKNQYKKEPSEEGKDTHVPDGTCDLAVDSDGNAVNADVIMAEWNKLPAPFPRIKQMTDKRKTALRKRLRDASWLDGWREALRMAPNIPFLRGDASGGWVMDIEFFLRPDSVTKIIEGKYGTGSRSNGPDFTTF